MRVLHIGKYFPPYVGGMETHLRDLMTEQSREGIVSSALVHRSELSLTSRNETYVSAGEVLSVTRAAVWARMLFTPISPIFPLLMHRMIRREQPEILHLHMPNPSVFWALLMPSAKSLPWVVQWHSDVLESKHSLGLRIFYKLYRPLERAVLRHSTTIIASSPPYLKSSEALAPFEEKCTVIPLGLDTDRLCAVQTKTRSDPNRLRVLAIGRLTYYKGFEYLIRAAQLAEKVEIRLVGSGDLEESLKRLAKELSVEDRVSFLGILPDAHIGQEYANCDCLCLPSIERTEAFGLVLLEAMYFSKATVVSDVPGSGMGWIVDDSVTGLKVSVSSPQGLADAFRQLQCDRDNLARLGSNGRRKFDRLFHISQSTTAISHTYDRVLSRV